MKIKVWVFALILAGCVIVGAIGGFVLTGGLAFAGKLATALQQPSRENITIQMPDKGNANPGGNNDNNGNNGNNGNFGNKDGNGFNGTFGFGSMPMIPEKPEGLPEDFNAGVSVAATYGSLTDRTEDQVNAAAEKANTNVWGLAQQEGKLDELKTKLTQAVTASLKQMVADKKITQTQSDSYLNWVKQYLDAIGQWQKGYGMMPGNGRSSGYWQPAEPGETAAPGATTGTGV